MMKRFFQICLVLLSVSTFCAADVTPYTPVQEHFILPQGTQLLAAKGIDGSIIELQDGAQFEIVDADREEVMEWKTNSPLMISPNPYWFSSSDFFITNRHTGTYVGANYTVGPVFEHHFTNRIFHIDPFEGEIILVDGRNNYTCWRLDPHDIKHIQNWEKGETVIIGVYDNWYSRFVSNAKFILISYENLDFVQFVRANNVPL